MLLSKFLMRFDIVEAYAEYLNIDLFEFENVVSKLASLSRAARGAVFGIKI